MNPTAVRFFALIPAAGSGQRMQAGRPKQYLPLHGRPILEHSLRAITAHPLMAGVMVVLSAPDPWWPQITLPTHLPVWTTVGGEQRFHSVLNGLRAMTQVINADDWVLVHDAARPCLPAEDLLRMITTLADDPVGGVLGVPIHDTVWRADAADRITTLTPRQGLWRAQTPQMFRYGALTSALEAVVAAGDTVTDEAGAMMRAGYIPRMVEGHPHNIKLTHPADLGLAEYYLKDSQ